MMRQCCLVFFLFLCVCGVLVKPLLAQDNTKTVQPFTTTDGPATVATCTPKALGKHPHPALLAACLYVPFLGDPEVWEIQDKPNRLLARYASLIFYDLLEKNYKRARQGGGGLLTFEIFFMDERFDDFEITDSSFDAEKGLAIVSTINHGKPYSYRVLFVVENGLWRVDDIHLFHYGCQMVVPIKTVVANAERWYRQFSNCGKR